VSTRGLILPPTTPPDPEAEPSVTLQHFLEKIPPGRSVRIVGGFRTENVPAIVIGTLPGITLYCGDVACEREQNFALLDFSVPAHGNRTADFAIPILVRDLFVRYHCRNCSRTWKTFALRMSRSESADLEKVFGYKFGEVPQFGPPLPAKLLQLAGEYTPLLKQGRQSENQSLGIGAFAYYRRVVESQKSRLIDELKNAIERLGGNNAKALAALEEARTETQFSKALELMADVTPKELYVSGRNPLTLLHGPLSVGLHGLSDEECLKKAHSIRIVLAAMLERVQMITEEKSELDAAIKDLL
jgi:hypothetical protein